MKAIIKYMSNEKEVEKEMINFKSAYDFKNYVEIKATDEEGIETNIKIPTDKFISIAITK